MKTVTVTRVGHPLPHPATPGQATEITVSVYTNKGYMSFPASPLSMLIRQDDILTLNPDNSLYRVNHLSAGMLNEYLLGFEGKIDRVSHPLWMKNPLTGKPELCVIFACDNLLCAVKAEWDTLLLRDNDLIRVSVHNREIAFLENDTLGQRKTPRFSKLAGRIKRISHPLACPDENGTPCLQTMIIMESGEFKIVKASPESMFLQDGDKVEITGSHIINERLLQFAYGTVPPAEYEVRDIGHPLPVSLSNGKKQLSRYLITTENKIYCLPANENNMLLRTGDKVIQIY